MLLAELNRALANPKLRKRIARERAAAFATWIRDHGTVAEDPASPPPVTSRDPDDDYLLALAIDGIRAWIRFAAERSPEGAAARQAASRA